MRRTKNLTKNEAQQLLVRDAERWRYVAHPGYNASLTSKGVYNVFIGAELQGVGPSLEQAVDAGIEFKRKREKYHE